MTRKIGLYGGTFDPLHFGHLNLAISLMESHHLDEVWFIPARLSPFKTNEHPVSMEHRLAMLNLMIPEIPNFHVVDIESKRPAPSYTIDTIKYLQEEERLNPKDREFFLLMGEDALNGFMGWKKPEEIIERVPLLIGLRNQAELDITRFWKDPKIAEAVEKGFTKTLVFDISSTEIRERLKKCLYCGHLIPAKVIDYIIKNHLYSSF